MSRRKDLELLRDAAQEAGELALDQRRKGLKVWSKQGGSPVTDADLAVNVLLSNRLRGARPDYGWLSEETADDRGRLDAKRLFVIDPIDGTAAYMKGRPWFTVAVAVIEKGEVVAGVVHAPELNDTYEAVAGEGATLNGRPIRASAASRLEGASMLGDPAIFKAPLWPRLEFERRNSIALRMALVAAGEFDAAVAPSRKHDWDVAAGALIAEQAGARVTDHLGQRYVFNKPEPWQGALVCCAPALHPLILERTAPIEAPV
jgi:myo-inositol-1(or 4)-monophosphatase